MDMEITSGAMENATREPGRPIKCTVMDSSSGRTAEGTAVNLKMIRDTELVNLCGRMEDATKETG